MRGTIESVGSGARLSGTMQLHEFVISFVGFFTFAAGTMFLSGAARSAASRQLERVMLVGLGVLVFLTAMTLVGFAMEVHRSFDELTGLVDVSRADLQ
jgi:uncharacterized membrane protein